MTKGPLRSARNDREAVLSPLGMTGEGVHFVPIEMTWRVVLLPFGMARGQFYLREAISPSETAEANPASSIATSPF